MIHTDELISIGFDWNNTNSAFMSYWIGGPWFIHAYQGRDFIGLMYGPYNIRNEDSFSIWATFTDIEKIKKLIELLKGDKQ